MYKGTWSVVKRLNSSNRFVNGFKRFKIKESLIWKLAKLQLSAVKSNTGSNGLGPKCGPNWAYRTLFQRMGKGAIVAGNSPKMVA